MMKTTMLRRLKGVFTAPVCISSAALFGVLLVAVGPQPVHADGVPIFEWNKGVVSQSQLTVSRHFVSGPVLADDFTPAAGGQVTWVEWWGSAPVTASNSDRFEVTFHTDAMGVPAFEPNVDAHGIVSGGIDQQIRIVGGIQQAKGIWHYTMPWDPGLVLNANENYWFSVANGESAADFDPQSPGNTWHWSFPGPISPTIGTEQYTAQVSVGGMPDLLFGPHDGPWLPVAAGTKVDFAFVVKVPEPASIGWMAFCGFGLLGVMRRIRG